MSIVRLPLFILALIVVDLTRAAENQSFGEDWRWAHFTTASGLPSNYVSNVTETDDGTIWAETAGGVGWFDGFRWHPIVLPQGSPPKAGVKVCGSLGDSVLVACQGEFFFGDKNGFRKVFQIPDAGSAIPLSDGTFLVTRSDSAHIVASGEMRPYQPPLPRGQYNIPSQRNPNLLSSRKGTLWVNLIDGLYRLESDRWKLMLSFTHRAPGVGERLIENDRGDGLFYNSIPTDQRGIWEWSDDSQPRFNTRERRGAVVAIDIDPDGNVIVAYESGEVRIRKNAQWSTISLKQFGIRNIRSFNFRKNGDLWAGTEHGLYLGRGSGPYWTVLRNPSPSLRHSVNDILRRKDGSIWLATAHGIEIHEQDGTTRYIRSIDTVALYSLTGLAEDSAGHVWVSSGSQFPGAFRWDGARWTHVNLSKDSLQPYIHKIRRDRRGRLWFCSLDKVDPLLGRSHSGAYMLEDGKFTRWDKERGLINGRVYDFAEGLDGSLWFATFGGLSRWTNGKWTHWSRQEDLRSNGVFALSVGHDGTVWFGAHNEAAGLGCVDTAGNIQYLTTADGLVNNRIWDITVGHEGEIWIATLAGLSSYKNGVFSSYTENSGLVCPIVWPVLSLDSLVYVGTRWNGLAILNRTEASSPPPLVQVDQPIVEENNALIRWAAFTHWGEVSPHEVLTRYKLNETEWSAWTRKHELTLSELTPGTHLLQVQAKGLIGQFETSGTPVTFTIQSPLWMRPVFLIPMTLFAFGMILLAGLLLWRKRAYDLTLRASEAKFRAAVENTSSAIFIYHDRRLLFMNSGATALTGYTEDELEQLTLPNLIHPDHHETFEGLEADRAEDTTPQRTELRIITKNSHVRWVDVTIGWIQYQGAPVSLATAFDITSRKEGAERLRALSSELVLTEERERKRTATFLHDVIGQNLALSKLKIRRMQKSGALNGEGHSLQELRELIEQSLYDTQSLTFELCPPILYELEFASAIGWLTERMQKQNTMPIVCEDDGKAKPLANDVRAILFQAVREMIVNAIKHAEASELRVVLTRAGSTVEIEVRDSGKGFWPTNGGTHPQESGGGFGLFNIRERLGYLGGTLDIASTPGKGTIVTITAPLQNIEQEKSS